jgi:hypothetical protein
MFGLTTVKTYVSIQSHLCTSDLILKIFFGNTKFRRISELFVEELLIALGVHQMKNVILFC